jgi:Flp pilus assembly protein TadG
MPMRRRHENDRGAALVEFALLLPILALLLFGTITGGLTLSRQNSVKNAAREGARFGAINPLGEPVDLTTYLDQVIVQVENAAHPDLANGILGKKICVAFIEESGSVTQRTKTNTGTTSAGTACFDDSPLTYDRVQVSVERRSEISAILYAKNVLIEARSVTRYER